MPPPRHHPHQLSATIATDCLRLPPPAPIAAGTPTATARQRAQEALPRVAALESLLEAPRTIDLAAAGGEQVLGVVRNDLAPLDEAIRRALAQGAGETGTMVTQAEGTFTAAIRRAGLPQCSMEGY